MYDELVSDVNQILRCFSDKRIGVNQTIKKTGLARNKGLDTISFLIDANIIIKGKDKKNINKENY